MYQIRVIYSLLNAPGTLDGDDLLCLVRMGVVPMADMPEQFNRMLLETAEK